MIAVKYKMKGSLRTHIFDNSKRLPRKLKKAIRKSVLSVLTDELKVISSFYIDERPFLDWMDNLMKEAETNGI